MRILIFIIAVLASASVLADPYPVASYIKVHKNGTNYRFDVDWSVVDLPDARRPVRSGLMYYYSYVLVFAKRPSGIRYAFKIGEKHLFDVSANDSMSTLTMKHYNQGITLAGWNDSSADPIGACIALGFVLSQNGNLQSQWDIPDGACTTIPPVDTSCSIVSPSLTLAHGVLVRGAGSSTAKGEIEVECSRATNANIKFIADGKVKLSNGETAILSAKDSSGNSKNTRLISGSNKISIESDIFVSSKTPEGNFTGSSVVYIEYL